jgi:predicted Zn-dependent protease with MMP-like domain
VGGRRVVLPRRRDRRTGLEALVHRALQPLREQWGEELGGLLVRVEDVPPELGADTTAVTDRTAGGPVPLARGVPGAPPQVVVYRKPLELRAADETDLAELVRDVVVEAVASLLGVDPEDVDPGGQG